MKPFPEAERFQNIQRTAPGKQGHDEIVRNPELEADHDMPVRFRLGFLTRMQGQRTDKAPIQAVVPEYDVLHRIPEVVPDTVAFPEQGRDIDGVVPAELLSFDHTQGAHPVYSESFDFQTRGRCFPALGILRLAAGIEPIPRHIVTHGVPTALGLFQEMGIEPLAYDLVAMAEMFIIELYRMALADG